MRILVAYDGSLFADSAIEDLRRAGLPKQADALVVCVAEKGLAHVEATIGVETDSDGSWRSKIAEAEALAAKAEERIGSYFPHWTISSDSLWGSPAKVLVDATGWWHPDLLIVGSHGRSGVARLFLGSVSLELIHKAACSVRVTHANAPRRPDGPIRIIIGHDGSPEAEMVIRSVASRSWPERTEAKIVSAVQTLVPVTTALEASTYAQEPAYSVIRESDERMLFRLGNVAAEAANALRRAGLSATTQVLEADPREAILTAADDAKADAIFVGARGLGRMERLFLGSVSSYVVTHARCVVEVARGRYGK